MQQNKKQTIIIIDGYDMVGKTTIAKELSKQLNIPYFKGTARDRWHDPLIQLIYGNETLLQFIEQTKCDIIIDRLYPSEYAYATAFGRPTSYEKIAELDKRYAKLGAKLVICYKDDKYHLIDDNIFNAKPLIDVSKYNELRKSFFKYAQHMTKCEVLLLNTSEQNLKKQVDTIIKFVNNTL